MRRCVLLVSLTLPLILALSIASTPTLANKYVVEDGDLLDYGYQLYVDGINVETRTEANPIQVAIRETLIDPPGLYDYLIGMRNGEIKSNIIIPPEEGYSTGPYVGKALTFQNLQIYKINGYHYTELPTQPPPKTFVFWLLTIGGGILGTAGAVFLIYGGYRFYPKLFGKRCSVCKKSAIGNCKNCGKAFCNNCYAAGCPYCKGRSLIRFK